MIKINGGNGDDFIEGGAGNDNLQGGWGTDEVIGNEGDDGFTLVVNPLSSGIYDGGSGSDSYYYFGSRKIYNKNASIFKLTDVAGSDTLIFTSANSGIIIDLDLINAEQTINDAGDVINLDGQFEHIIANTVQ